MLRQVRIHARPAPLLHPTAAHSQYRQFWGRQQHPNIPPDVPVYFSQPPKSRGSRLKDMAIGSALTVTGYMTFKYYQLKKYQSMLKELERELIEEEELVKSLNAEFEPLFQEAREAADAERLRELTFTLTRRMFAAEWELQGGRGSEKSTNKVVEAGFLPGFPIGDEQYGQEQIPVEDTLMFIEEDPEAGLINGAQIAVNAEYDSRLFMMLQDRKGKIIQERDAKNKMQELFIRFGVQAELWKKAGRVDDADGLLVVFQLRNEFVSFLWTGDGQFTFLDNVPSLNKPLLWT